MSIIIKGMEMPKSCVECPCAYWTEGAYSDICQAVDFDTDIWEFYKPGAHRPDWCPLEEVPTPHGRLIDADALCEALIKRWNTADKNAERIISEVMADVVTPIVASAPTIIEAEE